MNRKRILSFILSTIIVLPILTTPIQANASISTNIKDNIITDELSMTWKKTDKFIGRNYYRLLLNGQYYLDCIAVPMMNNPLQLFDKTGDEWGDLKLDELTLDECLKFVTAFNEAANSGYELNSGYDKTELAPLFGYGDVDVSNAAVSTVVRDCFLVKAVVLAKDEGISGIGKLNSYMESHVSELRDFTNIAEQQTGCDSPSALADWCKSRIDAEGDSMTQQVNDASVAEVQETSLAAYDDTYKHIKATMVLCAKTTDALDMNSPFMMGVRAEYDNVSPKEIVANPDGSEEIDLLNKVLTDAYNMTDSGHQTFKACMSLVLERGSKYSYGIAITVNTDEVKDRLETGTGNASADKTMEQALESMKKILDGNKAITDDYQKLYLTLPQRTRYAIALMSATDGAKDIIEKYKDLDDLCRVAGDNEWVLGSEPYIVSEPVDITHFDGYIYLNNIANDISKMASVNIPLLHTITEKENLKGLEVQLAELKAVAETNEIMNNPDQIKWVNKYIENNKLSIDNSKAFSPIEDQWSKEVTYQDSNGNDFKTSLKAEYERLSKLGVVFPEMEALAASSEHPLNKDYFSLSDKQVSAPIRVGAALSSTYIPFKTNVYNPITYKYVKDDDEFFRFHVLYGTYRKALYIDTDVASVSKRRTTGKVGSLKLCTLRDLLQCDKEITLYADDNFYNANKLEEYKKEGIDRISNVSKETEESKTLAQSILDAFSTDILSVIKTNENVNYSERLSDVDSYAETKQPSYKQSSSSKEQVILSGKDIDSFLDIDKQTDVNYNVMRAYALVSSVYRDSELFNYLNNVGVSPVFMSSKNMASTQGATQTWKDTYFNYVLLKNAECDINVNYRSKLDEGKPVYLDVYGNILTESGNVVIPAAANATLNNSYSPYTAAFVTTYGQKEYIPSTLDFVGTSGASQVMECADERERWEFKKKSLNGTADLNALSTANAGAMDELFKKYAADVKLGNLNTEVYIPNVIMETLRGAPLESIDKEYEGLLVGTNVSKNGISKAVQLESLKKSLEGFDQNTILSLPNLAYINGIEIFILITYKIALIVVIIMILVHIYRCAMMQGFGLHDFFRSGLTIVLVLGALYIIPVVFNLTYYQINKLLLKQDAINISMLNLEKREAGVEVGVVETGEPNIKSKLYLKLKDVDIPWYNMIYDIITSNVTADLTDIYEEYAKDDLAFGQDDFEFRGGQLCMDVDKLYDSSTVTFNANYNNLYAVSKKDTPASFYTPYYVFLHTLCVDVNTFNKMYNVYNYSTQVYGGGKVKSLGLIKSYFTSDYFIDNKDDGSPMTEDIFHLREIYKTTVPDSTLIYTSADVEAMQKSNWYNGNLDDDAVAERIEKLDHRAKVFIANNKDLIGRISDETFLKVMALHMACYYNEICGINTADSIDIYNLDADDLTRLSIAPAAEVINSSPLSFARFIYEQGDTLGVYAAALLEIVNFLSGWIKPLIILTVYCVIFLSLFFYKIVLLKEERSSVGYIYVVALLCLTNLVNAIAIKVGTWLPELFNAPTVYILGQILLQIIIIAFYLGILTVAVKNWKDLGEARFTSIATDMMLRLKEGKLGNMLRGANLSMPHMEGLRSMLNRRRQRSKYAGGNYYGDSYDYNDRSYNRRRRNGYSGYNRNYYNDTYDYKDYDERYSRTHRTGNSYEDRYESDVFRDLDNEDRYRETRDSRYTRTDNDNRSNTQDNYNRDTRDTRDTRDNSNLHRRF